MPELTKLVKTFLDRGDSVEEIAGKLNLDVQLAWSIALEGLDDQQRLEMLSEKVKGLSCKPWPYDVWNFSDCHYLQGRPETGGFLSVEKERTRKETISCGCGIL